MSTAAVSESPLRVALLGAPNSGKTTIFNALTGARAKVGNYPGVTVERREGVLRKIRPISIHGQISWNVYFNDPEDLNGPVEMERVGPESVMSGLEPGDLIRLEYLLGAVTNVTRAKV